MARNHLAAAIVVAHIGAAASGCGSSVVLGGPEPEPGPDPGPAPTGMVCSLVAQPVDIGGAAGEARLLAAGFDASGAHLLVLRGSTQPVRLELDDSGAVSEVGALAPGVATELVFGKAAFDRDGPRAAICERRDEQDGLRIIEQDGAESWRAFDGEVVDCTQVSPSEDHWLVLAKEWATEAPGTLLRLDQDAPEEVRLELDVPMRSPTAGEPGLFATDDGTFGFLYRPYELDSWPDEALRVLFIDGAFAGASEPLELLGTNIQNGQASATANEGQLAVVFDPQWDALASGNIPHLLTTNDQGEAITPLPLSLPSDYGGNFTIHGRDDDLLWAWVDPGPDFDPATGTGTTHRIVVQPISLSGDPAGPVITIAELGARTGIHLTLESRRVGSRLELLLAWQGAQQGGGTADVHAALLTCE
jgi:hypothetical protein